MKKKIEKKKMEKKKDRSNTPRNDKSLKVFKSFQKFSKVIKMSSMSVEMSNVVGDGVSNSKGDNFGSCSAETFSKGGSKGLGGLSVYISSELERQMVKAAKDLAQRAIMECGSHYNFDATEAIRLLGLENVKVERQKPALVEKKAKEVIAKAAFPLPYSGEFNEAYCFALRQNNGLYTQCQGTRKSGSFCKGCQVLADKNDGVPEYGTIQQRQAVGVFEYTDPKGRKPVSYTKVMKKYKVSEEQVLAEAGKFGMEINQEHFVVAEADTKRGRPKVAAAEKVSEPKGPKGRPKKSKKVMEIVGDEHEDLFAAMVANAQEECSDDESVLEMPAPKKPTGKSDEEKEALAKQKEEAKAAKEAQRLKEKAEKEAKLAAEKAEKEAKLAAEKAEKEAKKAAEKAEKEAKKAALEEAKAAKEVAKAAKPVKKAAKEESKEEAKEEEGISVNTIKVDGKKYLVSTTGVVYDYNEWKHNQEQVVLGKWNEAQKKIEFTAESESEESEEEYEEEEE